LANAPPLSKYFCSLFILPYTSHAF
jgi:hypothetical protein